MGRSVLSSNVSYRVGYMLISSWNTSVNLINILNFV